MVRVSRGTIFSESGHTNIQRYMEEAETARRPTGEITVEVRIKENPYTWHD